VPLSPITCELLKHHRAAQDRRARLNSTYWQTEDGDRLVFASTMVGVGFDRLGWPLQPSAIGKKLVIDHEAAGVRHIPFHGCRHTRTSISPVDLNMPLAKVSRELGHKNTVTTQKVYQHYLGSNQLQDDRFGAFVFDTKRKAREAS